VKNGLPSSSSSSTAATVSATATSRKVASPSRSSRRISSPKREEEGIAELQSPHAMKISEGVEPHRNQISKRNIATYVHNLSKKTVSMHRSKMTAAVPVRAINRAKSSSRGRPKKSFDLNSDLAEGMSAAFSPRTGRVVVSAKAAIHGSSEDNDDCNSDEYNRNMSEEEDGDF
jgi:hypothetical protein